MYIVIWSKSRFDKKEGCCQFISSVEPTTLPVICLATAVHTSQNTIQVVSLV